MVNAYLGGSSDAISKIHFRTVYSRGRRFSGRHSPDIRSRFSSGGNAGERFTSEQYRSAIGE